MQVSWKRTHAVPHVQSSASRSFVCRPKRSLTGNSDGIYCLGLDDTQNKFRSVLQVLPNKALPDFHIQEYIYSRWLNVHRHAGSLITWPDAFSRADWFAFLPQPDKRPEAAPLWTRLIVKVMVLYLMTMCIICMKVRRSYFLWINDHFRQTIFFIFLFIFALIEQLTFMEVTNWHYLGKMKKVVCTIFCLFWEILL